MSSSSTPSKGRGIFASWLAGVMAVVLIFGLLLATLYFYATFQPFYEYEYLKYDNARVIGAQSDVLSGVTSVLINYIKGKNVDLHIEAYIGGQLRQVFSEKEIAHMADVLKLFDMLRIALMACAGGVLLFFALSLLIAPKGARSRSISKGVLLACLAVALLFAALAVYVAADFSSAFLLFHQIFFAGDAQYKWILDPNTDVLIQMVPEGFFIDIGIAIGATFLGLLILTIVIAAAVLSRTKGAKAGAKPAGESGPDHKSGRQILQAMAYRPAAASRKTEPPFTAAPPRPSDLPKTTGAAAAKKPEPERPKAEEIFREMGIYDDSAVPEPVRQLIKKTGQPLEPEALSEKEIKTRPIDSPAPRPFTQEKPSTPAARMSGAAPASDRADTAAPRPRADANQTEKGREPTYEELMNRLKKL